MTLRRLPALALLALAALAAVAATAPRAATVTVTVTGADGQPAPNVVVQLETPHALARPPLAAPVVIAQRDVHFVPFVTAVPVGTTVRFTNLDPFDHHLRSEPSGPLGTLPPAQVFEFRIAAATPDRTATVDLRMAKVGAIVLGCHLHSSMRGHLFVSDTPLVAVTDAGGHATLVDVPEGTVELRTWHPEQLVEQPSAERQVGGQTSSLVTVLNFTPPKPRVRHS